MVNKWIQHIKDFASKHKISYREALKHPQCKASYKKGGDLPVKHIQEFLRESYNKNAKENVDGYILDKDISNDYAKVYFNPETHHAVVVHRGTNPEILDWLNNVAYATGYYHWTRRSWTGKRIQKEAERKYGVKNVSTLGHSQGAQLARRHGKNSKEVITVNPAYLPNEMQMPNEYRIRSSRDPVSAALAPVNWLKSGFNYLIGRNKHKEQNITIPAETFHPITEHSFDTLERLDPEMRIGVKEEPKAEEQGGSFKKGFKFVTGYTPPQFIFNKLLEQALHYLPIEEHYKIPVKLLSNHLYNHFLGSGFFDKAKSSEKAFKNIMSTYINGVNDDHPFKHFAINIADHLHKVLKGSGYFYHHDRGYLPPTF